MNSVEGDESLAVPHVPRFKFFLSAVVTAILLGDWRNWVGAHQLQPTTTWEVAAMNFEWLEPIS